MPFASAQQDFCRRLQSVRRLGLGLSVDVYSPDLFELMGQLGHLGLRPAYLEIFKASTPALAVVRRQFPEVPLTYHGEGLWVTQPNFATAPSLDEDLAEVVQHLQLLQSCWLNHECATKQMAGYSFGTYLPPLYTKRSASVVAENVALVQAKLDEHYGCEAGPLFLLEMAPLTYFFPGTLAVPDFFNLITERAPCGLVLDIGHLWTLYRYTDAAQGRSLQQFVAEFLNAFPLERIVEIHLAGLARHAAIPDREAQQMSSAWIDSHAAPIPSVLWDMLEQVLAHPGLLNLKAIALEVDTKPIPLIAQEFALADRRFGETIRRKMIEGPLQAAEQINGDRARALPDDSARRYLLDEYASYARILSGQAEPTEHEWEAVLKDHKGLDCYIHEYLPYEILFWGGDLREMFVDTCRRLMEENISIESFVSWWFKMPRQLNQPYDFFLLKIDRFLEFVGELAPRLHPIAEREASMLRSAYAEASENVALPEGPEVRK